MSDPSMIGILQDLRNENKGELVDLLVDQAGFPNAEARSFLSPALGMIVEGLRSSRLPLRPFLDGAEPASVLRRIDAVGIAQQAGVPESRARTGLRVILPRVLSLLEDRVGGAEEILSLLEADRPRPVATGFDLRGE